LTRPIRIGLVLGLAVLLGALVWYGFLRPRPEDADVLSGYVEGEALYLAAPTPGTVTSLTVARGDRVKAREPLFSVDARTAKAQQDQAAARLTQARAQAEAAAADLAQQGAALAQAEAQAANAQRDAARYVHAEPAAVSAQEVDRARTANADAQAAARAAAARMGSAKAQQAAAQAVVAQAQGALADVAARLDQMSARAPSAGRVEEVYFQAGEWAGANQPILSLIPDGKVKLRFFVPESVLQLYQPGRRVDFGCDGCRRGLSARIDYVSPRPEYTPPVIYSRKSRDKLVYLVEAEPVDAPDLTPGLPVDVTQLRTGARP
jgi:HlyD family secretion protein